MSDASVCVTRECARLRGCEGQKGRHDTVRAPVIPSRTCRSTSTCPPAGYAAWRHPGLAAKISFGESYADISYMHVALQQQASDDPHGKLLHISTRNSQQQGTHRAQSYMQSSTTTINEPEGSTQCADGGERSGPVSVADCHQRTARAGSAA